jgi:hypothetical protein
MYDKNLDAAKMRLEKSKIKIIQRHKTNNENELDDLVSGVLDEVELKRREKGLDDD